MLNNLFKKDGLNADQVRANALVSHALSVGDGQAGAVLVIYAPKHYDDFLAVHDQFARLKDENDTFYSTKQVTEKDIKFYVDYIKDDLANIGHGKSKVFLGLFAKKRADIDFIVKNIIDQKIDITYFVI